MSSLEKPWVKVNSETYLECIVGNKLGLMELEKLIRAAIEARGVDVQPSIQSDFKTIVCVEDEYEQVESQPVAGWQTALFQLALFTWGVVLPISGIVLIPRNIF